MKAQTRPTPEKPFEVHEHSYVSGPMARFCGAKLVHSHEGGNWGDPMHRHPHTGPASYTIDKDEWRLKTGLRGGGRKKFTPEPSGAQLPIVACEEWQKSFELIIVGPPTPEFGEGPGIALPARMILQGGMKLSRVEDETGGAA